MDLMSSELFPPIPIETVKLARSVFGRSNFYLVIGDKANHLFSGLALRPSSDPVDMPARTLAMYHLITVFQYGETLPDLLAADALRERVDWKYALHLPLNHPVREASDFSEFRKWLLSDPVRMENFRTLLTRLAGIVELAGPLNLPCEATQVIAKVCTASRLEKIWDSMSRCLEALAIRRPDLLRIISLPHWYDRYGHHSGTFNLSADCLEQEAFARAVGADGYYLLETVSKECVPELAKLPEIRALREVWDEQYEKTAGAVIWKKETCYRVGGKHDVICRPNS
jgi:transposase